MPDEQRKKVFVISPIGDDRSDIRNHADTLLHYVIKPAVQKLPNPMLKRADEESRPGLISRQIMIDLNEADLIIAVLTSLNPNVMYELGLAHSLNKPTIHLMLKGERLPFDNQDYSTIFYSLACPSDHEEAIGKLAAQVAATQQPGFKPINPFNYAVAHAKAMHVDVSNTELLQQISRQLDIHEQRIQSQSALIDTLMYIAHPSGGAVGGAFGGMPIDYSLGKGALGGLATTSRGGGPLSSVSANPGRASVIGWDDTVKPAQGTKGLLG